MFYYKGGIRCISILTEYRGRGIGQKLVVVHTSANNFNLYEKCGFVLNDLTNNGTVVYYGYIQARKDGHR